MATFGAMRFGDENGYVFGPETHVELPAPRDLTALIRALRDPALRPALLFVEGTSMDHEVEAFLAARAVEPLAEDLSGTKWPKSRQLHVPLDDQVVETLAGLAERLAPPEVCDHLVVYREDVLLLAAYDAGRDPVWLARTVASDARVRITRCLDAEQLT